MFIEHKSHHNLRLLKTNAFKKEKFEAKQQNREFKKIYVTEEDGTIWSKDFIDGNWSDWAID